MVGSGQAGKRVSDAKSVMLGGGLTNLEGGRMKVLGWDSYP